MSLYSILAPEVQLVVPVFLKSSNCCSRRWGRSLSGSSLLICISNPPYLNTYIDAGREEQEASGSGSTAEVSPRGSFIHSGRKSKAHNRKQQVWGRSHWFRNARVLTSIIGQSGPIPQASRVFRRRDEYSAERTQKAGMFIFFLNERNGLNFAFIQIVQAEEDSSRMAGLEEECNKLKVKLEAAWARPCLQPRF